MQHYPKHKYHPERPFAEVNSEAEEKKLGPGWYDSPAEYGVETCPGLKPDENILSNKPGAKKESKKPLLEEKSSEAKT